MATSTWSNVYSPATSAGFIAALQPLSTALQAVNPSILTKTSDTGQITWAGPYTPSANTIAGYEIYKFSDGLGDIYLKIEYGWASPTTILTIWFTLGTGSNGSGTITGIFSARNQSKSIVPASTTTPYPSYLCCTTGALWFILGAGGAPSSSSGNNLDWAAPILRTCDQAGNVTGDAVHGLLGNGTGSAIIYCYNQSTGYGVTWQTVSNYSPALIPFNISATNTGTGGANNYQIFRHQIPTPQVYPSAVVGTHIAAEAGGATTVSMALVGSTNHTYFFGGAYILGVNTVINASTASLVLIYE